MSRRPGIAPIVLLFLLAAVTVRTQGTRRGFSSGPDGRLSYATDAWATDHGLFVGGL
jgi:hypothetical protein